MAAAGPGVEHLLQLMLQDAAFVRAVQSQDVAGAASAAVGLVKVQFKAFHSALRPPGSAFGGGANGLDGGSPTLHRVDAGRRTSDPGLPSRPDLRVRDRVIINTNHKKYDGYLIGKEGVVLSITSNGWVKLQVGSDTLDIQMRYLTPLHQRPPLAALLPSAGSKGGAPGAQLGAKGGARPAGPLRKSDVVKQVRKELTQLEEQVPWKEVQDRWRTHRKSWTRRLRQADTTREVAICVREFHDHLRTDKTGGIFMAGGAWELSLRECMAGSSNHLQLLQVWEEMRGALQTWLAAGRLPGGLACLDKASYAQAVQTYRVLQDAAARGPECLEQVPLDQILTSQRELLALQHIIQREAAAAQSRLQAIAAQGAAPAADGGPPGAPAPAPAPAAPEAGGGAAAGAAGSSAAAAGAPAPGAPAPAPATPSAGGAPALLPGFEGGLSESVLLQLGKLPRIKAAEGGASDADTDRDAGSEATDVPDDMELDGLEADCF
ncbi:hypothetical protein HT031_001142 [Scenedesmus sp. PABB004]|nr:hypothetical protein HT031_001142 [Scenedesmus sp. PABB004]